MKRYYFYIGRCPTCREAIFRGPYFVQPLAGDLFRKEVCEACAAEQRGKDIVEMWAGTGSGTLELNAANSKCLYLSVHLKLFVLMAPVPYPAGAEQMASDMAGALYDELERRGLGAGPPP